VRLVRETKANCRQLQRPRESARASEYLEHSYYRPFSFLSRLPFSPLLIASAKLEETLDNIKHTHQGDTLDSRNPSTMPKILRRIVQSLYRFFSLRRRKKKKDMSEEHRRYLIEEELSKIVRPVIVVRDSGFAESEVEESTSEFLTLSLRRYYSSVQF